MSPITALLALAALVVAAVLFAVVARRRDGRSRRVRIADAVEPAVVGLDRWGDRATLLQFSTEFCARCPGVHRTLAAVADAQDGVEHVDVDLTHRADLATRFHVLQTPTTLVLDRHGVIQTRFGGVVTRAAVQAELTRVGGVHDVHV
ncbi:TlpA family protein disulfide reductase [Microbacterium rhizomatis]|uniref:Thioredoxin family protein n=1 Tax=Microbacterium rhizomatis TaxID=1631477 RepID=A0A5J5J5H0_9MICO|nr:thioredoxin family protein [Microbacterium rhizomatis]KAA9111437.1 thioredoxin family protein [Microbacterium rhizomatis]